MKLSLALLLIPTIIFCQYDGKVGINTSEPTRTLDINGGLRVRDIPTGTIEDYLLVTDSEGNVKKILISSITNNHKCPNLIKEESSGYNLTFKSDYSIPKPNNNPVIANTTFVTAGTWIQDNKYIYKYSNATGISFNINVPFTIKFDTLTCNYN